MPDYHFGKMFDSDQFKDFGEIGPGLRVVYPLATQKFPIGYINDRNTPADLARTVIDRAVGGDRFSIYHVQLAHDLHNIVITDDDPAATAYKIDDKFSVTHACDGLIIRRTGLPLIVNTLLGDCACIIVWSKDHVGYMHVGRPEIMAEPSTIENFFRLWPSKSHETKVWIGPCIRGEHYELPNIPEKWMAYATTTIWGTQGFDMAAAIVDMFEGRPSKAKCNVRSTQVAGIDPYAVNQSGDHSWAASDQWYRRKGRELGFPIFSPRNAAMLFIGE